MNKKMLGLSNTVKCQECNRIFDYDDAELDASGYLRCPNCVEPCSFFKEEKLSNTVNCRDCNGVFDYEDTELDFRGYLVCKGCMQQHLHIPNSPSTSTSSGRERKAKLSAFNCPKKCGKDFTRLSDQWLHLVKGCAVKQPHKCKVCGKDFADSIHLIVHQRSHK